MLQRRSNWFWSIICDKANALDKLQSDSVQRWETNCSLKDGHLPCTNVGSYVTASMFLQEKVLAKPVLSY